eukprot:1096380-Amphidinium_carterae.1
MIGFRQNGPNSSVQVPQPPVRSMFVGQVFDPAAIAPHGVHVACSSKRLLLYSKGSKIPESDKFRSFGTGPHSMHIHDKFRSIQN